VIESLIKCGAFDAMGYKRRPLMSCYEEIMDLAQRRHREKNSGQSNIFDHFEKTQGDETDKSLISLMFNLPEWEPRELLANEKEMLGFYITGHPLSRFAERLRIAADSDSESILEKKDKEEVRFAGVVSNIRDVTTKRKELMAYVTFEDLKGSITSIFFADVYRKASDLLHGDEPILVKGVVDIGEDSIKVIATEAVLLSEALDLPFQAASFRFDTTRLADHDLEALRNLLKKYPGKAEGYIHLRNDQSETVIHLGKSILFAPSKTLKEEADRILGAGATEFR